MIRQQALADARLLQQGQEQVGQIQQTRAPALAAPISGLQQLLERLADIKLTTGSGGLLGADVIEPIQQPIQIDRQRINPGGEAAVIEQGLQQMLHIHLPVAPAARLLLAGQQQIPGRFTETVRLGGEAGAGGASGGGGVRRHGRGS